MKLRVLQIIDSLEIGGAEKMAVQLANSLTSKIDYSALCCTRKVGILKTQLYENVPFIHLNKKNTFDISAVFKLRKFVKKKNIHILHAHGSSYFIAVLIKLTLPHIKIVWHDHYGLFRNNKLNFNDKVLIALSCYFSGIIVVKKSLNVWANKYLKCKNIHFINNYSQLNFNSSGNKTSTLMGDESSFKIIQVANFRPQKDHLTGLKAIKLLIDNNYPITYHLFGNYDKEDIYFKTINEYIESNKLTNNVFIYGPTKYISNYLTLADVGLLTSTSEGLPLSLVEYALAKLPVVVSNVGECKNVVGEYAKIFEPKDYNSLYLHLVEIIENKREYQNYVEKLYNKVFENYSEEKVIKKIVEVYKKI